MIKICIIIFLTLFIKGYTNETHAVLFNAQKEIFELLKTNTDKLQSIRKSDQPLVDKWQQFLQVILPIQLEVIQKYGFKNDQSGLSIFNQQYMEESAHDALLLELNKEKWLLLFKETFGVSDFIEVSLEEARNLIADIAREMTSSSFLTQIDQLEKTGSFLEKRKALLTILFPLHMSVMKRHGFEGEKGYIQAQRAIMDYYFDPIIVQNALHAQTEVFKRAQLQ